MDASTITRYRTPHRNEVFNDIKLRVKQFCETRPLLSLELRKGGDPPMTPPECKSFGTRLIEMGLSGSSAEMPEIGYVLVKVVYRIAAALDEL